MKNVQTKRSASIEIANAFMNGIRENCSDLFLDNEFKKRFCSLMGFIDEKRVPELETDIVGVYVVYEQEPPRG
ncbi:MAG: hypothetical protein HDT28_00695 [Clostridiales bacterium]|nr:hypothetical protein [Clostridiales bacterium]